MQIVVRLYCLGNNDKEKCSEQAVLAMDIDWLFEAMEEQGWLCTLPLGFLSAKEFLHEADHLGGDWAGRGPGSSRAVQLRASATRGQ